MRLCPSVEGSASPLITHRIGVDVCLARQRTFFHKCHRCIYRDQAADWEPAAEPLVDMHVAGEPMQTGVKVVDLPATRKAAAAKKSASSKPAGKPAAGKPGRSKSREAEGKVAEAGG